MPAAKTAEERVGGGESADGPRHGGPKGSASQGGPRQDRAGAEKTRGLPRAPSAREDRAGEGPAARERAGGWDSGLGFGAPGREAPSAPRRQGRGPEAQA